MDKKLTILILSLFIVILFSGCATVPPAPEPKGEWVPIKLTAKGNGASPPSAVNPAQARLMTERAAKMDAMRNLLEQINGVYITSKTKVKDFVTQSDTIKAKVEGYVQNARVINTNYLKDGSIEVEIEVTLGQEFRRIFP
jgi:hypothetical protein